MKKILVFLLASTSLFVMGDSPLVRGGVVPNVDSTKYPQLYEFVQKYKIPSKFHEKIEECREEIEETSFGRVGEFFLKGTEIDRIINAERMRNCIKKHKLSSLDVAKKYVGPNFKVFAKHIRSVGGKGLSLQDVQHFA